MTESLLDEARNRLRQDYYRRNKSLLFERLLPRLTQPCQVEDYQILAQELGISTSAVKVALHRLRQRFGQTLRDVVAETVEEPQDVDAELTELLNVLKTTTES